MARSLRIRARSLRRRVAPVALLVGLLASIALGPTATHAANAATSRAVIVRAHGGAAAASEAVTEHGGTVSRGVDLVGAAVGRVPADRLDDLAADDRVVSVTPDHPVRVQSDAFDGRGSTSFAASVGAPQLWDAGIDGAGVGVALLDTGVADHPALAGKVRAAADLTTDGDFRDRYGHGTFLAGLVAGSAPGYRGVAPGAHLLSVKVAGADGTTTLGQVLYGLQLIDSAKDRYGIRVVLLALATPADAEVDPLDVAVERLWADGLVVVVAAGNDGPAAGTVTAPGDNAYVVTVGATDDAATSDRGDDRVPAWTSRGPAPSGIAKPDLAGPGASLISLRAAGSTIDTDHPIARVAEDYFRGSGTSMSAAVAAGAAALLLDAHPELTPDAVKGRLTAGAATAPAGADPQAVGHGSLDVAAAVASQAGPANGDLPPLAGGSVQPPADPDRAGRRAFDWHAGPVGADLWLTQGWAKDVSRHGIETAGRYWAGRYWAGRYWADSQWAGRYWADQEFLGRYWAGRYWAGRYWAGGDWAGRYWAGRYWAARYWASASWS